MALVTVLNSQRPTASLLRRRDSMFGNGPDTDEELEPVSFVRPSTDSNARDMSALESMLGGTSLGGLGVSFRSPSAPS
ncbi:hypothetical protein JCM3770_000991 [Rhodotorula araucariae]